MAHRRAHPLPPPPVDGFLAAEQALLLGHLHHPAPKSRDGLSATDSADFSPEQRGSFRLHWFAADLPSCRTTRWPARRRSRAGTPWR
ncbi:IucA/IucC family protein [Myxococcus sp. 1LA]